MMINTRILWILSIAASLLIGPVTSVRSQSSQPIVVDAATPAPAALTAAVGSASSESTRDAIKSLQELKAANEEMLKRQQAALEQLDQLEKAAEQLKIFANRS
jgi:hypothetical protein